MTTNVVAPDSVRPPGSRLLHRLDRVSPRRPGVAWTLLTADLLWLLYSIAFGFPARWETIFQTVVAAITLALVFVIQHTQARWMCWSRAQPTRPERDARHICNTGRTVTADQLHETCARTK